MSARRVLALAAAKAVPESVLAAGARLEEGSDLRIEVLHPPPGLVPDAPPISNDNSVVVKLTKGTISVLLTGDIEEAGLPWLLRERDAVRATVLKVPHHGSRLGEAGERFFRAVHPSFAMLSVGRLHHLPAEQTVRALERSAARLYSTRRDGAIRVRTDGTHLEVTTFKSKGNTQKSTPQVKSQPVDF